MQRHGPELDRVRAVVLITLALAARVVLQEQRQRVRVKHELRLLIRHGMQGQGPTQQNSVSPLRHTSTTQAPPSSYSLSAKGVHD